MRKMASASTKLFLFIFFLLQTSTASSSKLLGKDMLQFVGNFLEPDSARKMKKTSKQWSDVKIYENILPNELEVAVFRNVNTAEIIWEAIKFKKLRTWETKVIEELKSHLRRNNTAKWNDVFVWFAENRYELISNKSQNVSFLKELMLAIAENIVVTFTHPPHGMYPMMIAASIDDANSILTLIKRGTNVHRQNDYRRTALHYAAFYGNINACTALLENNANIDAMDHYGETPLMYSAWSGKKNVFEFLIEKGADKTFTNSSGKTAFQLARF